MFTTLAFILTLGILVTVHEYGHFQVARWCGVKVLKFSIGFGKPLWCKKIGRDQTEFIIAAIPLGGYVKMLGEEQSADDDSQPVEDMARALNRQSVFKRMAIVLAGPIANLLLAVILYWGLLIAGTVGIKPFVGDVAQNTPASAGNFQSGDMIQRINGKEVVTWQDVQWVLLNESLKKEVADIQVIDRHQLVHNRHLRVSGLHKDEVSGDITEKLGLTIYQPKIEARIGEIIKNSPADLSGLQTGDLVLDINGSKVSDWLVFVHEIRMNPGRKVTILVQRESENKRISVTLDDAEENGKSVGRLGAGLMANQSYLDEYLVTRHYAVAEAFAKSLDKTWETSVFSLKILGNMLLGNVSWKGISGPVTIASYAGQSASMGIKVYIGFLALVSISIGILNLLPIPILDGGHFMYYMVEFFTGKPVSEAVINFGQRIGLFILGWMMVLALYNDINRLITG